MIAHSMGGMVAVRAALLHPDKFKGMVLIGPLIIPGQSVGPLDFRVTPLRGFIASWALWFVDRLLSPQLVLGFVSYDFISRDEGVKQLLKVDPLRWQGGCKVNHDISFNSGDFFCEIRKWDYLRKKSSSSFLPLRKK